MEDKSLFSSSQPRIISEGLQNFIDAMVEGIVLEGRTFDTQKKYLKKFSENEGLDYEALENKLSDFIEVMKEWRDLHTKSSELMAKMLAKDCYLSESGLKTLFSASNVQNRQSKNEVGGHEYVDLGLPSGTLWASCNIGASKSEEYGEYFAWGETRPKSVYDEETYKYYDGAKFTKYMFEDCLKVLQPEDDAATANWGEGWRMPTKEEWEELLDNTTNRRTKQNGVNGILFVANNGTSLFLPAAGYRFRNDSRLYDSVGHFWSSSLRKVFTLGAWNFKFGSDDCGMDSRYRGYGFTVRPVRSSRQN